MLIPSKNLSEKNLIQAEISSYYRQKKDFDNAVQTFVKKIQNSSDEDIKDFIDDLKEKEVFKLSQCLFIKQKTTTPISSSSPSPNPSPQISPYKSPNLPINLEI